MRNLSPRVWKNECSNTNFKCGFQILIALTLDRYDNGMGSGWITLIPTPFLFI